MAAIKARLHTPEDANGVRQEVDVVTSADCIYFDNGQNLEEKIETITESQVTAGIIFTDSMHKPVAPALWGEIWSDTHNK